MEELLLINPSPRRKKHRSAAQKRATSKMLAANRARRKTPIASASRTAVRRRKNKSQHVSTYYPNPSKRARRGVTVHHRRYKRNPAGRMSGLVPMLKDSAIGAVGAVAIEALFGFLPIPMSWKMGRMMMVAKGATAVAVGMFGNKLLPSGMAGKMAVGSLTVTMHDALKPFVAHVMPSLNMGYYPGGMLMENVPGSTAQPAPALSEYLNSGMHGMDAVDEYMGNNY